MRELLSTGIGLVLVAVVVVAIVTLWRSRLHPGQLAVHAVSSATVLGILGLAGILPALLWWVPWLLGAGLLVGVVLACRRLLVGDPPTAPTRAQAKLLARPSRSNVVVEAALCVLVLAVAVTAG